MFNKAHRYGISLAFLAIVCASCAGAGGEASLKGNDEDSNARLTKLVEAPFHHAKNSAKITIGEFKRDPNADAFGYSPSAYDRYAPVTVELGAEQMHYTLVVNTFGASGAKHATRLYRSENEADQADLFSPMACEELASTMAKDLFKSSFKFDGQSALVEKIDANSDDAPTTRNYRVTVSFLLRDRTETVDYRLTLKALSDSADSQCAYLEKAFLP